MRPIGTRRVSLTMNSPSSSGEPKDDKLFSDTVPVDEMIHKDDFFDTQVVDYDDDDCTQPVDFDEETQIMDLAGETQVMDDYEDIAGETQLLIISDSATESESDGEGAGRTQVLDDTVHLNDIQIPDTIDKQTNGGENTNSRFRRDDGGARVESPPSTDATQRSGSSKRGFTSVRTASLRAAGLAARKMASENAENGSSKCHFINNNGICSTEKADLKTDMAKLNVKGLSNSSKSDVARSLARKLFMEDDVEEDGSDKDLDIRMEDMSRPHGCDGNLAGLSYVDSQEPGDLSQANALEFVDKFLKVSVFEADEDVTPKTTVSETVTASAYNKGTNSIAQEANCKSRVASPSVFEWDNKVEDDGGGEFFIKKRELMFGKHHVVQKSCDKTSRSRHFEAKVGRFPGRMKNEKQNVHDTNKGPLYSDSKLVKGRKVSKFDEIGLGKEHGNFKDPQSHSNTCDRLALNAPPNAESAELLNVGIDTQMAAEAMEALSTVLVENNSSMCDKGLNNLADRSDRGETKKMPKKQSFTQKRAPRSNSGVVTRSKRKSDEEGEYSLALRPRSQHLSKELKGDLVKARVKRTKTGLNNTTGEHQKESSDRELQNADCMGTENKFDGELHFSETVAVKRQSLRKKQSTTISLQKNTQATALNQFNGDNGALDDSRKRKHCTDGVQTRKHETRTDLSSGSPTTAAGCCMLDGSIDNGRDLHQTCDQGTRSGKIGLPLTSFAEACQKPFISIARRTRSKRRAKGLNSSVILSSENVSKLSLQKEAECCLPVQGNLAGVSLDGSCGKIQESSCPADITPNNLKTPKHAVSPVCMGDEYRTPSCKKNLFLRKECYNLTDSDDYYSSPFRVLRQRRDVNNVRVLFSQHLEEDIVKQQKKIVSRLGFCEASSVLEATHFVADMFVRTRNMLEAIADAKFVVTHLWLESCGQANCFIDEKNFILRDTKKEKELGFSMPMSLARASRHPILEGRKVFVTPNIKPSKEVISSLVKSVHGQAIGRLCRSTSNNEKLLDDLLILSCEEDFEVCLPLLEKGIAIYSSELLLNGIITQRLEYERHRLFASHVKKTRSTLWLKKEGDKILRVPKTS